MEPEFIRWSTPHLTVLALTVVLTAAFLITGRCMSQQGRYRLCRCLAMVMLLELVGEYALRLTTSEYGPWQENLPLQFCTLMGFISVIALWTRARRACSAVYFCVLTASIQALITPALAVGWPSIRFVLFFLSHSLLMVAALSGPILLGWRARGYDDLRAVLLGDAYLLCIIPVNIWLGTNYGFTRVSPAQGSMLDYLGAAPYYYLWLQLPAWGIFRFMYLFVRDKSED